MTSKLVIFTGAGISADSGISTFRGADGLWENHSIDRIANYWTWKNHRDEVHAFYNARRSQLPNVSPNEAHIMVARLQVQYAGTRVITQNIDDLHERGGATDVLHVHGKLTEMKCEACGNVWDVGYNPWGHQDSCPRIRGEVRCGCRKGVKPNVIFFNEMAPNYSQMHRDFASLTANDVLLVIGTSGAVVNIGSVASMAPATTILSNLEASATMPNDLFTHTVHGRASETAGKIEQLVASLMV